MSDTEESKIIYERIESKMEKMVIRKKHLNFEKKEERKWNTRYYKKNRKYGVRGRTGQIKQDKIMLIDRKVKEIEDESKYFIFIKEIKKSINNKTTPNDS